MPDNHSKRWYSHLAVWKWSLGFLCLLLIALTYRVHESKAERFDKVKASRRGAIRTAKEKKQTIVFTQHRTGVSRNVWIQEPEGERRQFFLEATSAEVSTSILAKENPLTEIFTAPKGCLQEELFWEVSSTGERVVSDKDRWVRASPPHSVISEKYVREIVPVQRVRFFEAKTATWDPGTNKLVANITSFRVLKLPGHDLPKETDTGQTIAAGTATSIIFQFDKKGRQQVNCQGVKLHLNQGATK